MKVTVRGRTEESLREAYLQTLDEGYHATNHGIWYDPLSQAYYMILEVDYTKSTIKDILELDDKISRRDSPLN